ncbi:MAG: NapC/NirT family cytochrome c [Deltaproteobacteria bacterium]|nr:NapC/NirT family cytochrome c [Deltaproteobacteria bacterium]
MKKKSNKKTGLKVCIIIIGLFFLVLGFHEVSIRYFQDKTCVVCHEMQKPIENWKKSETALNHNNCAGCHYTNDLSGWLAMNKSAVRQLIEHFKRDPEEPIKLPEEPLFLDTEKEPGYWSLVPNSRCFQCKTAKNHKQIEQASVHGKLIKNITNQPCKDCHNHEIREGQKFFEKVLPKQAPDERQN